MRLQSGATQIALRTSQLLQAGRGLQQPILEPTWYRVVLANPPTHQLLPRVRGEFSAPQRLELGERSPTGMWRTRSRPAKHLTRTKHLFRSPRLEFVEDAMRQTFYRNHPWELARPRNIVESDGKELARCDWSHLMQPHIRLSGESLVRHALWRTQQPEYRAAYGDNWRPAYDAVRVEYYRLRMQEFAEHQVAAEEAAMAGAVFGPSAIDGGIAAEQRVIDKYIAEARVATDDLRARGAEMVSDDETAPSA